MTTYISILRGINVSGKKLIKMEALRDMYGALHFQNITSYVQSGNVVFATKNTETAILAEKISTQIKSTFGFDVPVIVMTIGQFNDVIANNMLAKDLQKDASFLHVTFLASAPKPFDSKLIEDKLQSGEEIRFSDQAVYLYCPYGYGKTKLTNNFLVSKLKVGATTRNWKTTNELLKIAQSNT